MSHEDTHRAGYTYLGKYGPGAVCGVVGGTLLILAGDDVTIAGIVDDAAIPPTLVVGGTICAGYGAIDALVAKIGPACGGWLSGGGIKFHVWVPKWWNIGADPVAYPTCA